MSQDTNKKPVYSERKRLYTSPDMRIALDTYTVTTDRGDIFDMVRISRSSDTGLRYVDFKVSIFEDMVASLQANASVNV